MDELTPLEPEYREIPPEQPSFVSGYYGTGIQPQPKKSKTAFFLSLIILLLTANFIAMFVSLFMGHETTAAAPTENVNLSPIEGYPDEGIHSNSSLHVGKEDSTTLKAIYDHFAPSTVAITAQSNRTVQQSTGVILTEDGYVLTDSRILVEPFRLTVTLHDGTTCDAAFIGMDPNSEMAILKIERTGLTPISLDEEVGKQAFRVLQEFLESAVRPATLDLEVSEVTKQMQVYWHLPVGVIVNRIRPNSNAYRVGLRPGDVLLKIGQISLRNVGDYLEALSSYSAGETVRIYLFREGKTYYADILLESEN